MKCTAAVVHGRVQPTTTKKDCCFVLQCLAASACCLLPGALQCLMHIGMAGSSLLHQTIIRFITWCDPTHAWLSCRAAKQ